MRNRDYEDVSKQADTLAQAFLDLRGAITEVAEVARSEARMKHPDVDRVLGKVSAMRRAAESVDLATLDLATARGEDA